MNFLNEYYKLEDEEYKELVEKMRLEASETEKKFLFDEIDMADSFKNSNYVKICEVYRLTKFFPTHNLISNLKDRYSLTSSLLDWFIPIEKLEMQFERIANAGILIQRRGFLILTHFHLITKFNYHLLQVSDSLSNFKKNSIDEMKSSLKDYRKRYNYHSRKKDSKRSEFDKVQAEYYENLVKITNNGIDVNAFTECLIRSVGGNTRETIIKPMAQSCFIYDGLSKTDFLDIVYDLFQIILQDEYLPDENAFNKNHSEIPEDYRRWRSQKLGRIVM